MLSNPTSTSQLQSARPTISIGGQDQPPLQGALLRLQIVKTCQGLYHCEAVFDNWGSKNNGIGFLYFDRSLLEFGKALEIKLNGESLFSGRIMGLEAIFPEGAAPTIAVLAEDRFQDLRMTRRTRTFKDVSDSDVFSQIANDHGLTPQVQVSGGTHKILAQINQSDLAFLLERCRAIEADLWMDGTDLHVQGRSRSQRPLSLTYGGALREFNVLADLAGQRTSVTASGWDVAGKSAIAVESTDSVVSAEIGGDTSGASVLRRAIGERKENLAHSAALTSQDAQAVAESYFKISARRFLVGHGVAATDARLDAGAQVDLHGLGPLFSGKYWLAEVCHIFDLENGMRTTFTAEKAGLGTAS